MSEAGKGDKQRPTDQQKFSDGWDRIFGKPTAQEIADSITGYEVSGIDDDGKCIKEYGKIYEVSYRGDAPTPKDANIHPSCSEPFCSCMDTLTTDDVYDYIELVTVRLVGFLVFICVLGYFYAP